MPAHTTRQEARARIPAAFRAQLGRIIPEDEQVPLKGATFADFEDQIEDLARAALPVALEQRAAWEPSAPVGYDTGTDGGLDETIYSETFDGNWFSLTFGTESYDAAGNLLKDALYEYTYDAWNRLVKVERRAGCQAQYKALAVYRYDGLGRRIYKDVDNCGTRDSTGEYFYYDNQWRSLEVRNAADAPTRQFVWGPRYIDEAISMSVDTDADGICTDFTDTGTNPDGGGGASRWYYMQDANWNVVRLWSDTITTGLKSERYEYDPYGTTRVVAGYDTSLAAERLHVMPDSLAGNPFRCAGYYYDDERGAYLVRYRMYLPWVARWGQTDPLGYAGGSANLREYVLSSPVVYTDPSGLANLRCPPGTEPRRKKGPTPTANGCGAGPWIWIVPDKIGKTDFTKACNNHDLCYANCNKPRADCDREFEEDMAVECYRKFGWLSIEPMPWWLKKQLEACLAIATAYRVAVEQLGEGAHTRAQETFCECCPAPPTTQPSAPVAPLPPPIPQPLPPWVDPQPLPPWVPQPLPLLPIPFWPNPLPLPPWVDPFQLPRITL